MGYYWGADHPKGLSPNSFITPFFTLVHPFLSLSIFSNLLRLSRTGWRKRVFSEFKQFKWVFFEFRDF